MQASQGGNDHWQLDKGVHRPCTERKAVQTQAKQWKEEGNTWNLQFHVFPSTVPTNHSNPTLIQLLLCMDWFSHVFRGTPASLQEGMMPWSGFWSYQFLHCNYNSFQNILEQLSLLRFENWIVLYDAFEFSFVLLSSCNMVLLRTSPRLIIWATSLISPFLVIQ